MNWTNFQTHGESPNKAFEAMCNQLFFIWCKEVSEEHYSRYRVINGSGGDGGVEAYGVKENSDIVAVQAKWFPNSIQNSQINQIRKSIITALKVRPYIVEYIVCIPRDLASKKMTREGKVSQNVEQDRWDKLQDEMERSHEGLKVVLWNETYLLELLQRESARGVNRYWFHNSELSETGIWASFTKQQHGWLYNRYIPNLHKSGKIKSNSMRFLGNKADRVETYEYIQKNMKYLEDLSNSCASYAKLMKSNQDNDGIMQILHEIKYSANELFISLKEIGRNVYFEDSFLSIDYKSLMKLDLNELKEQLEERKLSHKTYFHITEILKAIEAHHKYYSVYELRSQIENQFARSTQIFMGDPGTGKTHGIAGLAEYFQNNKSHIPVVLRAKSYSPDMSWLEIIKIDLGLSSQWSEEELWQAFEAISISKQNTLVADDLVIIPKIIVCLDGLDESHPYEKWIERLREFDDISKRYPRIKLVVTSRSYVFDDLEFRDPLLKGSIRLNTGGDVSADILFDDYVKYYGIDTSNVPWVKWALKTPLALKLFCDLYKGSFIKEMQGASVTITELLHSKLKIMEGEFARSSKSSSIKKEHIVHKVLGAYVKCFILSNKVNREDLLEQFSETLGSNSYEICKELVDYLECEGFVQSYTIYPTTIFKVPKTVYSIGIQPYFDYLAAIYIFDNNSFYMLDELSYASLQMLAIMLLEDQGILIGDSEFASELSEHRLFELNLFALANVSKEKTKEHSSYLLSEMKQNAEALMRIVNDVIINVSRINNHPLGARLLHEFLEGFGTVAERDLIWSIPAYLTNHENEIWYLSSELSILKDEFNLVSSDIFDGLPLVYAWALTTTNNGYRKEYRKQLFNWGRICPGELLKLLDLTYGVDDVQMKEDLMAVAMSVVMCLGDESDMVAELSNWTYQTIFEGDKITSNLSCAIRYYGRAIMEKAYSLEIVSEEEINDSRPPYNQGANLAICTDALSGTRMSGYGPIDYDLARYVLVDPMESRFFEAEYSICHANELLNNYTINDIDVVLSAENELDEDCMLLLSLMKSELSKSKRSWYTSCERINNDLPKKLLSEYVKFYGLKSLTSTQLILCAAYERLLTLGWTDEVFVGKPNGGKDGEILGLDVAILRQHHQATHGSQSSVMQFAEKYSWIARNELYGFLADRLIYTSMADDEESGMLNDYGLIGDFPNPAQEYVQLDPEDIQMGTEMKFIENIPANMNHDSGLQNLKNWISEEWVPDFRKWLYPNEFKDLTENEIVSLYGFHSEENKLYGETLICLNAGLISLKDLPILINDAKNKKSKLVNILKEPTNFHSSAETHCYITPTETTWFSWKKQLCMVDEINTVYNGSFEEYEIYRAVEECVANYHDYGDVTYRLPSAKTREMLGITYGDGYRYKNETNETLCYSINSGERWKESQSFVFADNDLLKDNMNDYGLTMFWTVRVLRRGTPRSRELYKNFYHCNDRTMFVYHDGERFNSIVIYEKRD